ncbi:MAG: hypothetical protein FJ118_01065 [Deltaproteobacteria bacterium]|nr:hypothetical protein [Deltaproteobacteria bacterium]
MRLIETHDLNTWADSKPAESRFPYWIKELICAVIQPDKIRFPSGSAVWVPGCDGTLVCSEKHEFVPTGYSVWEVSTRADIKTKANLDYRKRSDDKTGEKLDTTFVFATPRLWKDKNDWVNACKKEGIWKDVLAVDGVDLVKWIEDAPAVNLKLIPELGYGPETGLQTADQAWEKWSQFTSPSASEELVTVGRQEQEKDFIERLVATPSTFTVRGDSPREAWGFVLAAIRRLQSDEERMRLYARTIVAEDEQVAGRLPRRANLIILLKQAKGQVSGNLCAGVCHVIIPEGTDRRSERNVITLARPDPQAFLEALERMGLERDEAVKALRASGRSVTILQRQKAHANFERPVWADGLTVANLIPAVLAGRWDTRNEGDLRILYLLAGTDDYLSAEAQLQPFLSVDEAPIQKIGEMWTLTAPVDAFQLTARDLTSIHLSRFREAFRLVFGRVDPKVEIPPDERVYHDIRGDRGHSEWLRSGMAETLLLIAERGPDAELAAVLPRGYAEDVVKGLPGLNDDWRTLGSLRDQYSRLMEATPNPFLEGLERQLVTNPESIRRLFEESHTFGAEAMHTGLLWGLETLAWGSEYLPRVALLLARMARLDPGGKIHNRPINSLREIFLWWHPGTNASTEQRLAALDLILREEPETGWALLAKLLPGQVSSVSHPTAKPRWHDFGDLPEDSRTRLGQFNYASAIMDRALDLVGSDRERWEAIFQALPAMSPAHQTRALKLLHDISQSGAASGAKEALWEALRDLTYRHRSFRDAHWSLAEDVLNSLESILARLAPENPVDRNRWLFDEWIPVLPSATEDPEEWERQADEFRRQAIREILEEEGVQGLIKLGTTCRFPGFVAFAAVPEIEDLRKLRGLIEDAIAVGERGLALSSGISGRAQQLYGEAWSDLILQEVNSSTWSPAVIASLLVGWPDCRATWEIAAQLGDTVEAEYWKRKRVSSLRGSVDDQIYEIHQLISVRRAAEAFDRIAARKTSVPSGILLRLFDATLEELVAATTPEEVRRLGLSSYNIAHFLDEMRQREDIPRQEVARREYQALPLLASEETGRLTIHEYMSDDATFFVDVLCEVFLPKHRDKSQDSAPTAEGLARGRVAFRLLERMFCIPGEREGQRIEEDALLQWIDAVRAKAAEKDRSAIADLYIGKILAHAPEDPDDGGWPHRTVRNVIERLGADDIERGLTTERFNMRGMVTKDLYEGGDQERTLASQYHTWGRACARWPRMAKVLHNIARDWDDRARREDAEAEQDKSSLE